MKRYLAILMAASCCLFSSCGEENKIIPEPDPVEIRMSETLVILDIGQNVVLKALDVQDDSVVENVVWLSLNESVASVSKGAVTAISGGTAIIRAVSIDGASTAECKVIVNAPAPPSDIDFGGSGDIEDFH